MIENCIKIKLQFCWELQLKVEELEQIWKLSLSERSKNFIKNGDFNKQESEFKISQKNLDKFWLKHVIEIQKSRFACIEIF